MARSKSRASASIWVEGSMIKFGGLLLQDVLDVILPVLHRFHDGGE